MDLRNVNVVNSTVHLNKVNVYFRNNYPFILNLKIKFDRSICMNYKAETSLIFTCFRSPYKPSEYFEYTNNIVLNIRIIDIHSTIF